MKEEKVTKNILNWLEKNSWKIVCFDFPQSGTGVLLHPNSVEHKTTKNKGGIIPDIIAVRNSTAIFIENKDRFVLSDFEKIENIKISGNYSISLNKILSDFNVSAIYYGIGIPEIERYIDKSLKNKNKIDFLISTNIEGEVKVNYDKFDTFNFNSNSEKNIVK